MPPMRLPKLASACVLALSLAGCGTVRPANVAPQCRSLGNELATATGAAVDEIFEGGVAAGCWARPSR